MGGKLILGASFLTITLNALIVKLHLSILKL